MAVHDLQGYIVDHAYIALKYQSITIRYRLFQLISDITID